MKKIYFLIVSICTFSVIHAQVSIGLKGGTSFASINVKESYSGSKSSSTSSDNRTGFMLGGYATISMSEKIKLQPEFFYQGMGGSIDNVTFKNEYISVPILLKYGITDNFFLEAGPQFAVLLSSKAAGQDIKDAFKSSDFQVLVGASLNLTDKIGVGARYGTSMTSIATDSYSNSIKTDVKNRAFTVMLSYKLF